MHLLPFCLITHQNKLDGMFIKIRLLMFDVDLGLVWKERQRRRPGMSPWGGLQKAT